MMASTFCLAPPILPTHPCSAELAAKLHLLEGKLLHGERQGGLDKLARAKAAQLSRQQEELKRQQAAEAEAARRIAALEANAQAVQTQYSSLQVCAWRGVAAAARLGCICKVMLGRVYAAAT